MSHPIGFRQSVITIAAGGTAQQLSASSIITSQIEFYIPSGNTTVVYIGDENITSSNGIPRATGSIFVINASERGDITSGDYFDLSKIYVLSATTSDTIRISYTARES